MAEKPQPFPQDYADMLAAQDQADAASTGPDGETGLERATRVWNNPNVHPLAAGSAGLLTAIAPDLLRAMYVAPVIQETFCAAATVMCAASIAKSAASIGRDAVAIARHVGDRAKARLATDGGPKAAITPAGMLASCRDTLARMGKGLSQGVSSYMAPFVDGYRNSASNEPLLLGTGDAMFNVLLSKFIGSSGERATGVMLKVAAANLISGSAANGGNLSLPAMLQAISSTGTNSVATFTACLGVCTLVMGGAASATAKVLKKLEKSEDLQGSLVTLLMSAASVAAEAGASVSTLIPERVRESNAVAKAVQQAVDGSPALAATLEKARSYCAAASHAGSRTSDAVDGFLKANGAIVEETAAKATSLIEGALGKAAGTIADGRFASDEVIRQVSEKITGEIRKTVEKRAEEAIKERMELFVLGEAGKARDDLSSVLLRRRAGVAVGRIADFLPQMQRRILMTMKGADPAAPKRRQPKGNYGRFALSGEKVTGTRRPRQP